MKNPTEVAREIVKKFTPFNRHDQMEEEILKAIQDARNKALEEAVKEIKNHCDENHGACCDSTSCYELSELVAKLRKGGE